MPLRYLLAAALSAFLALSVGYDLGLTAGLAVGLVALAAIAALYLWLRRTGSEASWAWQSPDVEA